jgi:hypothetical protein
MSLGHPWAAWGLVAVLLLLLLALRRRQPTVVVTGTLALWAEVAAAAPSRSAWQRRLRRLLPPLVVAVLLVLGATGPVLRTGSAPELALLIDTSASTGAGAPGVPEARLQVLVAHARDLIEDLPPEGQVTLILPPRPPQVVGRSDALAALRELEPARHLVEVGPALRGLVLLRQRGVPCWFLGDATTDGLEALAGAGGGILLVGEPGVSGGGVTGLAVGRQDGSIWLQAEGLARGQVVEVRLEVDGHTWGVAPHRVGEWWQVRQALEGAPGRVAATVRVPGDRFAADDRAMWEPRARYAVLPGTPVARGLTAALAACGWEQVGSPAEARCVVMAEGGAPAPAGAVIRLATPGERAPGGRLQVAAGAPPAVQGLVEGLRLEGIQVAAGTPGWQVLLRAGETPLLERTEGQVRVLFDLDEAPALLMDEGGAFPVLWSWVAEQLAPGGDAGLLDPAVTVRALGGATRHTEPRRERGAGGRPVGGLLAVAALLLGLLWGAQRARG